MVTIIDICDDMIRIELCVFLLQETTKEAENKNRSQEKIFEEETLLAALENVHY